MSKQKTKNKMKKKRIQIDGVWFVEEQSIEELNPHSLLSKGTVITTHSVLWEDSKYFFEVTVDEAGTDAFLDILNKTSKEKWCWDNYDFLVNLADGKLESLQAATLDINANYVCIVQHVLIVAIEKFMTKKSQTRTGGLSPDTGPRN